MRPITHLAALAAILTLTSCDALTSFEITEESAEATVEGSNLGVVDALPVDALLPPLTLDVDLEEELDAQDAGPASAVRLTALSMTVTDTARPDGDEDSLDFIDTVTVYVESADADSALEPRQIATLDMIPEGATEVDFAVDDAVDLKPYIEEGIRLTTQGSGEVPEDDTSLKAIVTLTVELL